MFVLIFTAICYFILGHYIGFVNGLKYSLKKYKEMENKIRNTIHICPVCEIAYTLTTSKDSEKPEYRRICDICKKKKKGV